jgi:hypothetical protein
LKPVHATTTEFGT